MKKKIIFFLLFLILIVLVALLFCHKNKQIDKITKKKNLSGYNFIPKNHQTNEHKKESIEKMMKKSVMINNAIREKNKKEPVIIIREKNLMFRKIIPKKKFSYFEARDFCEKTVYSGYSDWRLPSVKEFRNITKGCKHITSNGDCKPGSKTIYFKHSPTKFSLKKCSCMEIHGPGKYGCYWDDKFWGKDCIGFYFWAYRKISPYGGILFSFENAGFGTGPLFGKNNVLCVRELMFPQNFK